MNYPIDLSFKKKSTLQLIIHCICDLHRWVDDRAVYALHFTASLSCRIRVKNMFPENLLSPAIPLLMTQKRGKKLKWF